MVSAYTVDRLSAANEQGLICTLNQMGTSVIFHNIFLLYCLYESCKLHYFAEQQKDFKKHVDFLESTRAFCSLFFELVSGYQRQPLPNAAT